MTIHQQPDEQAIIAAATDPLDKRAVLDLAESIAAPLREICKAFGADLWAIETAMRAARVAPNEQALQAALREVLTHVRVLSDEVLSLAA